MSQRETPTPSSNVRLAAETQHRPWKVNSGGQGGDSCITSKFRSIVFPWPIGTSPASSPSWPSASSASSARGPTCEPSPCGGHGGRSASSPTRADDDAATVVYSGAGPWEDGAVAWRLGRDWDEVLAGATGTAAVFAALGNGTRLRIVAELLRGPVATGDLAARLDWASSGQLFHHLRELLAAGVVYQPVRGTYAIRRQHVVPLLAVLSAAIDIAMPTALEPA